MGYFRPEDSYVGIYAEDAFRAGKGDEAFSETVLDANTAFALESWEDLTVPTPYRKREDIYTPGYRGDRPTKVADLGYAVNEGSLECWLQHGRFFYFAMGEVSKTGAESHQYVITSTTDDLPTFTMHTEQDNSGAVLRLEHMGCVVSEFDMVVEKEAKAKQNVSFKVPSVVTDGVNVQTDLVQSVSSIDKDIYTWADVVSCDINDGTTQWTKDDMDMFGFKVTNEVDLTHAVGGPKARIFKQGKRMFEFRAHIYPTATSLYNARQARGSAGSVALTFMMQRDNTSDYIQITATSYYVAEYPNKMPTWDEKILGLDVTFKPNADGAQTVTIYNENDDALTKFIGTA